MKNLMLATENFSTGKRNYFIDFKRAENDSHYLSITRSDLQFDGAYKRSNVIIFEEDFHFLISAMSSLFHSAAHLHQDGVVGYKKNKLYAGVREKGVKSWQAELRPREKLIAHGVDVLTDAELIAMLIGSGRPDLSAVALSENILSGTGGRLDKLAAGGHIALAKYKGIGKAKSCAILAALELGRRMCAV